MADTRNPYYKPWRGHNFNKTGLMILSESAYKWKADGRVRIPTRIHPAECVRGVISSFDEARYLKQMSRALCGTSTPTTEQMKKAWNGCAYTIYVQQVLKGTRSRPTKTHWKDAEVHFRAVIEKFCPSRVVVTGKTLWEQMPKTLLHRGRLEAYALSDGRLVWCMAIPHPANRTDGFDWKKIHKKIEQFKAAKLQRRLKRSR